MAGRGRGAQERVEPVINDIMSGEQLLRYALAAQCTLVENEAKVSQRSLELLELRRRHVQVYTQDPNNIKKIPARDR